MGGQTALGGHTGEQDDEHNTYSNTMKDGHDEVTLPGWVGETDNWNGRARGVWEMLTDSQLPMK